MSPQDAFFLRAENNVDHMHSASVAVFEGPAPSFDETVELIRSKLHLVPRYRQTIRFVPLDLGRPLWMDDPHFNIEYHIRHTSLPRPGSDDQLRTFVGRVMSQQLDRAKPLWERHREPEPQPAQNHPAALAAREGALGGATADQCGT
jgi:hypothetical protein